MVDSEILDFYGSGTVYALPLAARGHRVHLIDPVSRHVERARELSRAAEASLASAHVGDARSLGLPACTFDVVLLFGPLYHLPDERDRLDALAEARRVLVPGGLLLSSYISRFAFTTAYFHRPDEIRQEIDDVGLQFEDVFAVEGPGWGCEDLDSWLDDDSAREYLLRVLRRLESEPSLIGASPHLIAVSRK